MEGVPMRLVLAVLGLGGCFTTEDTFLTDAYRAGCAATFYCSKADFLVSYDDVEDCVHENENEVEDAQDYWDESNCDYEPLDAEECLAQIRLYGITCNAGDGEAIAKECDDVYDCE